MENKNEQLIIIHFPLYVYFINNSMLQNVNDSIHLILHIHNPTLQILIILNYLNANATVIRIPIL